MHPEFIINIEVNIARTLEELTIKTEEIENILDKKEDSHEKMTDAKASEGENKEIKIETPSLEEKQEEL